MLKKKTLKGTQEKEGGVSKGTIVDHNDIM